MLFLNAIIRALAAGLFALLWIAVPARTAAAQQPAPPHPQRKGSGAAQEGEAPYAFFSRGTETVAAGARYAAGPIRGYLIGNAYRDAWTTPVEVPVIDLARTAGGLTPIRRGGGLQTTSLHLRGADGHQYVLRSVDKDARRSLPEQFHGTFVADIAQDMIVSLNPFAAFALPPLAEAAGVLHTAPTLVVIPDDPRLEAYRDEFAGMLALFERKPDEDQSGAARFGNAANIIGSEKLFEEIEEDNDDRVDERAYARARLFDMLVGDWDRHDDQWRWAEFEGEHGKLYRAVPRDRDFALVRFDGLFNRMARATRNVMMRRLTNFEPAFSDVLGLNWQGAKLDLRFTSSLTRADWVALAEEVRQGVTDEAIERALRRWPAPIYDRLGAETAAALRARREQLPEVAEAYYELLARTVDLVGTDKHERFEVTRLGDDRTEVVIYKTKKEGDVDRELYRRTFLHDETQEVRLYGLGGNDQFVVTGEASAGLRVRAIGGAGADAFEDRSRVRGPARLTHVYDTEEGNVWALGPETRLHRARDPHINRYEMRRFEFDTVAPVMYVSYTTYDGFFYGGGLKFTRTGFRKEPYAAQHEIAANYAPQSRAYNVRYEGDFVRLWQGWGANVTGAALAAYNYRHFYGLGNDTDEDVRDLYRARLRRVTVAPSLTRRPSPLAFVSVGPRLQYVGVDPHPDLAAAQSAYTPEQFVDKYFAGLGAAFVVDGRDSLQHPRSGLRWASEASLNTGVRNTDLRFARLASEVSYYQGLGPTPFTLAFRLGGATNLGDFAFYQANTLGGESNLRGYRQTRFAGHSSVYANAELRARLFDFNIYLTRGEVGALGFYDTGRVYADGEESNTWHQGYGGGLWVAPFYQTILTATAGFGGDGLQLDFGFGFFF